MASKFIVPTYKIISQHAIKNDGYTRQLVLTFPVPFTMTKTKLVIHPVQ